MNSEQTDALRSIKPLVVQEYLRSRGWSLKTDLSARGLVEYENKDEVAVVPLNVDLRDYARRLHELLEVLVQAESVTLSSLLSDLMQPAGDVLAVRVESPSTQLGTLPFEDSLRLRLSARNLLLAAAHSERSPQAWFPRMARSEAVELLGKVQEGQTQRGSFVTQFIVPTSPAIGELDLGVEPFGRRVVKVLLRGLEAVRRVRSLGDYEELTRLEKEGVSGNLLAALATMGPSAGGAVEFSVSWARNYPAPSGVTQRVHLPNEALVGLDMVAEKMRGKVAIAGFELQGYVTHLAREATTAEAPGEITLVPSESDTRQFARVSVQLDAFAYEKAIAAHKNGDVVRVTGTLKKAGRRWTLEEATGFDRMSSEPEAE